MSEPPDKKWASIIESFISLAVSLVFGMLANAIVTQLNILRTNPRRVLLIFAGALGTALLGTVISILYARLLRRPSDIAALKTQLTLAYFAALESSELNPRPPTK